MKTDKATIRILFLFAVVFYSLLASAIYYGIKFFIVWLF